MKKILLGLLIAGLAVLAMGLTGFTIARANGLDFREVISGVSRAGFHRVDGAPMEHRRGGGERALAEYIDAAIAEAFGLSVGELADRRAAGESLLDIAASQGMTVEAFQALVEGAHQSALDNALADGVITQEQADSLLDKPFQGHPGGPLGGFGDPHQQGFAPGWEPMGLVEDVIGLTSEELHERLQNGETFEAILESQGFTPEEFAQAVADARIEAVQAAADNGEITQEQADLMVERIRQMLEEGFQGFGIPGLPGLGRGRGPGHGRFGPFDPHPLIPDDSGSDSEAAEF